jgi:hypothetical protein
MCAIRVDNIPRGHSIPWTEERRPFFGGAGDATPVIAILLRGSPVCGKPARQSSDVLLARQRWSRNAWMAALTDAARDAGTSGVGSCRQIASVRFSDAQASRQ